MSVYDALHENVPMIMEEATTRQLEKDMEKIVEGKKTEEEVIGEGKKMLVDALKLFDSNKSKISEAMKKGLSESNIGLGKCPKDGGDLVVRKSRMGKQFAACANYPKCTNTYSLPAEREDSRDRKDLRLLQNAESQGYKDGQGSVRDVPRPQLQDQGRLEG